MKNTTNLSHSRAKATPTNIKLIKSSTLHNIASRYFEHVPIKRWLRNSTYMIKFWDIAVGTIGWCGMEWPSFY